MDRTGKNHLLSKFPKRKRKEDGRLTFIHSSIQSLWIECGRVDDSIGEGTSKALSHLTDGTTPDLTLSVTLIYFVTFSHKFPIRSKEEWK